MKKWLIIGLLVGSLLVAAPLGYRPCQRARARAWCATALEHQMNRDWPRMEAAYRKAIAIQPDCEDAWTFLAWHYAYNVSAEFDRIEDKYAKIRYAIEIGIESVTKNPRSSQLQWNVGWTIFHRIGRAFESKEFRVLFARDEVLLDLLRQHVEVEPAFGPDGKIDSFLIARAWFRKAAVTADDFGRSEKLMSHVAFYLYSAHAQAAYAEALGADGFSDEVVIRAWQDALRDLQEYGNREFTYSASRSVRLYDHETLVEQQKALVAAKNSNQQNGSKDLKQTRELEEKLYWTTRYRLMINFDYWLERCRYEPTQPWLATRRMMFEARQHAATATDPSKKEVARELFEQSFHAWSRLIAEHAFLQDDAVLGEELVKYIALYQETVLDGRPLPADFPLRDAVARWQSVAAELQAAESQLRIESRHK